MLTLWPVADRETVPLMRAFYGKAFATRDPAQALSEVQRERLVELRKKQGLSQAVRLAGPFILSR
jgi:CHAT domain-containing protein